MQIEIVNYTKKIKKNIVLKNVNLKLYGGKIYGFRGQNGCGKTMLMRAISGLIRPTKGYVRIDNKIICKDIDFPDSIGLLIENPSFIEEYTAYDNLKILAELKGEISDEEIKRVLDNVLLDWNSNKLYNEFSLGMKQKLGIAAAIMGNPDIIILDEPINALDEKAVLQIKWMLQELRDENRIIIIACHDREELDYLADEIIEIKDGEIVGERYEVSETNQA